MAKRQFFVGILLVLGAVAYLIYTGIRETSNYYLTIEEFLPQKEAFTNEGIRLAGRVQAGSIQWDPKDLRLQFLLGPFKEQDHATVQSIAIHYQGILPDMFAEGRDVIVEGRYEQGSTLTAKTIMTSCPSKYEPEKPGDQAAAKP
ncbi:MAG: cytochrome c maturation protein CcmE [Deltaproteobacteria bacterium]|nr:cytochrome c maturation protein CcmE [Deltaproteobacteria bacterium]